jgi:hypothetical protein
MKTKKQNSPVTNELTLKFYQVDGIEVTTKFTIENDTKDSILIGTALNELFTLQSNYRKAGLRLFKSSQPVLFLVQSDDEIIMNVGKCQRFILDKLKFNKTAKSMKVFSKRVNLAITEMKRNITLIDYSEVEKAINSIVD